jgi:Leucine-rich repeat (LRR) protein
MCIICEKKINENTERIICCQNVKKIPKLKNLKTLAFSYLKIKKIPKELINLKELLCHDTPIKKIPKTLVKLRELNIYNTNVKFIPENLKVITLRTEKNILVSPKTYKQEPNNQRYLTFTNCQKRYKYRRRLSMLKFAYDPKYIIGYNVKLQINKLLTR